MLCDETLEPDDDFGNGAMIGGNQIAQVFRIEARGQCSRVGEIARHHCQLTALRRNRVGAARVARLRLLRQFGRPVDLGGLDRRLYGGSDGCRDLFLEVENSFR
jgi:hypothetical protein